MVPAAIDAATTRPGIGGARAGAVTRALDLKAAGPAPTTAGFTHASSRAPADVDVDGAAALALLGDEPLRPTGALRAALDARRLLRTGSDDVLDGLERMLRTGRIDDSERRAVGEGMNGVLYRVRVHDPAAPGASPTWVVEKPAGAQAAQEELGWRLARALGIDHLVPAAVRREDGTARIMLRPGEALSLAGIHDVRHLEQALAAGHLRDAALGVDVLGSAQSARIERQLLQVFDYLLANNDRRAANGLYDAATGTLSFIDSGHAGRGTLQHNGGSVLEPALQAFQAGRGGGRVDLDPVVVDYLRRRLRPEDVRAIHRTVFDDPEIAGPAGRTIGERFIGHVRSDGYREGMVQRLEHVLESGGYSHAPYRGDAAGELPPLLDERANVRGLGAVRRQFGAFDGARF